MLGRIPRLLTPATLAVLAGAVSFVFLLAWNPWGVRIGSPPASSQQGVIVGAATRQHPFVQDAVAHLVDGMLAAVWSTSSSSSMAAGAASPAPAAAVPSTAPSTHLALFYHPPDTSLPAPVAGDLGSAILTRGDETYSIQLRALGFSGPSLQYLVANEASGPDNLTSTSAACGTYQYYPADTSGISGNFCSALHGDETNFLHNSRGERLYSTESWQQGGQTVHATLYLMNPGASGWRSYVAQQAAQQGRSLGYSGLFLDNVDLDLQRGQTEEDNSDGTIKEYASDDAYRTAVAGMLAAVRTSVGPNALLWANLAGSDNDASEWDAYLPSLDGAMEEFFVAQWSGSYADGATWQAQVARAQDVLAQGKSFLAVAQGLQEDQQRQQFALASYLLVSDQQHASFRYADYDSYDQLWLYDDYWQALGAPTGTASQDSAGLWHRSFACGQVTVNVPSHQGSINVTTSGC